MRPTAGADVAKHLGARHARTGSMQTAATLTAQSTVARTLDAANPRARPKPRARSIRRRAQPLLSPPRLRSRATSKLFVAPEARRQAAVRARTTCSLGCSTAQSIAAATKAVLHLKVHPTTGVHVIMLKPSRHRGKALQTRCQLGWKVTAATLAVAAAAVAQRLQFRAAAVPVQVGNTDSTRPAAAV